MDFNTPMPAAHLTPAQAIVLGVFSAFLFLFLVVLAQIAEHRRAATFKRVRNAYLRGWTRSQIRLANKLEDDDAYHEDDLL